jgi:hypothetical protein
MTFNIKERFLLLTILNNFKGNLDVLTKVLDDLKKLRVDDEEAKEIELNQDGASITWKQEKSKDKEIQLSKEVIDWIKDYLQKKSTECSFTINDSEIVPLMSKLN